MPPKGKPVTIRGVEYTSQYAAAESLNVTEGTVRIAASKGQDKLDRVGLRPRRKKVKFGARERSYKEPKAPKSTKYEQKPQPAPKKRFVNGIAMRVADRHTAVHYPDKPRDENGRPIVRRSVVKPNMEQAGTPPEPTEHEINRRKLWAAHGLGADKIGLE